jgi:UDP-N-acetylglucosamine acyltransferase
MGSNETFIHPSAVVHPKARLGSGVYIGPSVVIGSKVSIQKNTRVDAFVYIEGATEIGEDCHFFPYSTIGTEPQDISYKGEESFVKIGDRNVFREFMTVHRGTVKGGGKTLIGDDNYFMAYSHIAHDCFVGNKTVFNHGATIGGHCYVGNFAQVGALSGMHQFCRIGKYAFTGGYSVITQDVLSFCRVAGSRPPFFYGLNAIGLRRQGFSRERIRAIKGMFKLIFYSELNTSQAVEKILREYPQGKDRDEIIQFIKSSKRGIIKKVSEE